MASADQYPGASSLLRKIDDALPSWLQPQESHKTSNNTLHGLTPPNALNKFTRDAQERAQSKREADGYGTFGKDPAHPWRRGFATGPERDR